MFSETEACFVDKVQWNFVYVKSIYLNEILLNELNTIKRIVIDWIFHKCELLFERRIRGFLCVYELLVKWVHIQFCYLWGCSDVLWGVLQLPVLCVVSRSLVDFVRELITFYLSSPISFN